MRNYRRFPQKDRQLPVMPTYRCKIADPGGHVQERNITADSKEAIKVLLANEGKFPLEIRAAGGGSLQLPSLNGRRRFTRKDFYSFNQEFAVLIRAGLPIVGALNAIIEKGDDSEFYEILREIRDSVSAGESLSGAFEKYGPLFSGLYIASLRAGEKSGNIPTTLTRYIDYLKKTAEIRKKIISASIYPLILIVASFAVLFFLMVYVVPTISSTFLETGTQLPMITNMLIQFSTALRSHAAAAFVVFAAGAVLVTFLRRMPEFKEKIDHLKMTLPYMGDLYSQYATSKLTRTLATVLEAGIPLLEGVRISSGIVNNQFLFRRLDRVAQQLEQGGGFAQSLEVQGGVPSLAVRMIAAGEGAGSLPEVLNDVADFYDSEVDAKLSVITSTIEPALMILMGLLIGFIVLALYLPIFQLAGTIG